MTRLAVIGDVHGRLDRLAWALDHAASRRVDGVLLVGDIGRGLGFGSPSADRRARFEASVADVLAAAASLGVPLAWVPGNHDLPDTPGAGNVDGRCIDVAGLRVAGLGGSGPAKFGFPYEWTEVEAAARPRPACDVWLVHTPPLDTPLDFVPHHGAHVGSAVIREIALNHRGFLVCGHIHESPGAVRLGACLALNAGGLGEPFGRPQVAYIERDGTVDRAEHHAHGREPRTWSLDHGTGIWADPGG